MNTNNKTLADVQPGGRVRLGDALPPMPSADYNAYSDGSEPLYTSEQMLDYARAALSAQPSPGGQGDAVHCGKCKDRGYVHVDVDVDDSGGSIGNIEACPHCALAARQPVGEAFHVNAVEPCGKILYVHPAGVKVGDTLYAAPPAQAVDLEQFRPAVCAMGLYAEEPEDVDEAKRLLALIDSQAVGK